MKHIAAVIAISTACVLFAAFAGQPEQAGLFGAIIGVGYYAATRKGAE